MRKALALCLTLSLLSSCSHFEDRRVVVRPETRHIDTSSYEFRYVLSKFIKNRYKTTQSIYEIMADLALAEDKLLLKETEK